MMRRGLGIILPIVLVAVWLCIPEAALAASNPDGCPTGKPLVVNSYLTYVNASDVGADGHVWALDAATESLQNGAPARTHIAYNDMTLAPSRPSRAPVQREPARLPAGRRGPSKRPLPQDPWRLRPDGVDDGLVGSYDVHCQQDGSCLGFQPRVSDLYFSRVNALGFGAFLAVYDGGTACGTWIQSTEGNSGDIVC
jgi:hypothetical protein